MRYNVTIYLLLLQLKVLKWWTLFCFSSLLKFFLPLIFNMILLLMFWLGAAPSLRIVFRYLASLVLVAMIQNVRGEKLSTKSKFLFFNVSTYIIYVFIRKSNFIFHILQSQGNSRKSRVTYPESRDWLTARSSILRVGFFSFSTIIKSVRHSQNFFQHWHLVVFSVCTN